MGKNKKVFGLETIIDILSTMIAPFCFGVGASAIFRESYKFAAWMLLVSAILFAITGYLKGFKTCKKIDDEILSKTLQESEVG